MSLRRLVISAFPALVLLSLFAGVIPVSASPKTLLKATYIWHTRMIQESAQEILAFSQANEINTIYLQINRDIKASAYKKFIGNATAQGVRVYALGGAPDWALQRNAYKITRFMEWLNDYQSEAAENEKFAEIHVDIEPYLLPEWKSAQRSLIQEWQSNLSYLIEEGHAMQLSVSADMPFWFDDIAIPGQQMTLGSWMINQLDSVTIMAYRDSADKIIKHVRNELKAANEIGKPIMIAVETNTTEEPEKITFHEEGVAYMQDQLSLVRQQAEQFESFAGFAIHDFIGWKALADR